MHAWINCKLQALAILLTFHHFLNKHACRSYFAQISDTFGPFGKTLSPHCQVLCGPHLAQKSCSMLNMGCGKYCVNAVGVCVAQMSQCNKYLSHKVCMRIQRYKDIDSSK